MSSRRCLISGDARPSPWPQRLVDDSRGVAAGASMLYQTTTTMSPPDSAWSARAGTCRRAVGWTRACAACRLRELDDRRNVAEVESTCPPRSAVSEGASPCTAVPMLVPVRSLKSSPDSAGRSVAARRKIEHAGLERARAISSLTLRAGTDGCTTSRFGACEKREIAGGRASYRSSTSCTATC